MITEINGECEFRDCYRKATQIAVGRDEDAEPRVYCDDHAEAITLQGRPVLVEDCPNCHCGFGVWP